MLFGAALSKSVHLKLSTNVLMHLVQGYLLYVREYFFKNILDLGKFQQYVENLIDSMNISQMLVLGYMASIHESHEHLHMFF